MKRYELYCEINDGRVVSGLYERKYGDYVLFEDAEYALYALEDELKQTKSRLEGAEELIRRYEED